MKRGSSARSFAVAAVTLWMALVAGGLSALMRYDIRPGAAAVAPSVWPVGLPWEPARQGHTVVVALHPFCPCSEATLTTLGHLLGDAPGRPQIHLLFRVGASSHAPARPSRTVPPENAPPEITLDPVAVRASRLWQAAAALPGQRHLDPGGALAERFGALTSGAVVVFAPDGRRVFAGGLTVGRGVQAWPRDLPALAARVFAERPTDGQTPVFGCALHGPARS